jgi:hypothetical protein
VKILVPLLSMFYKAIQHNFSKMILYIPTHSQASGPDIYT